MTTTYTSNKLLALQGTGDNSNTWGSTLNTSVITIIDTNLGGNLSLSVAGSSNVTLTNTQAQNAYYTFTGALTGNITVYWPANAGGTYVIYNNTSGSYTLTVAPSGGSGVVIPQGATETVFLNTTTVTMVNTNTAFGTLSLSGTLGIGTTAASYGISVVQANAIQAYFGSTGANASLVTIDNAAGGNTTSVAFSDAGTIKWELSKQPDNSFVVYDYAGSASFIHCITSGNLVLGPAQTTYINQSGQVGIGGTPSYTLDVAGVIRGKSDLFLTKGGSPIIATTDAYDLRLGTSSTEHLRIQNSNGYVGIGTSSPSALLEVNGTSKFDGVMTLQSSSIGQNGYTYLPNGLIRQWGYVATGSTSGTTSFPLTFPTNFFSMQLTTVASGAHYGSLTATSTSNFSWSLSSAGTGFYWEAIGN